MTDTQQLVDVLKQLLKARGLTYADLAPRLGLSHASVKRLFSAQTFTLGRLADVRRALEIDVCVLVRASVARPRNRFLRSRAARARADGFDARDERATGDGARAGREAARRLLPAA